MKKLLCVAIFAISTIFAANAQDVSEDLLMHDFMKGNVKRYVQASGELSAYNFMDKDFNFQWVYFDNNGKLIRDGLWKVFVYNEDGLYVGGQFQGANLERNERGHIKRMTSGDFVFFEGWYDVQYSYNQFGKVETENYDTNFSSSFMTYKYDANNELVSMHSEYDAEGNEGTVDETYTITKRDSHGNWIERKMHRKQVETDTDGETTTSTSDEVECRYIEYYAPDEKSVKAERFVMPVVVKGTNVRLRLGPSTSHQIYSSGGKPVYPRKGEKLKYIGETEDFYQVEYKKAFVYISKKFAERDMEYFLMN